MTNIKLTENIKLALNEAIPRMLKNYFGELNDNTTREIITSGITSILEPECNCNSFPSCKVICNDTNNSPEIIDAHELRVQVIINTNTRLVFYRTYKIKPSKRTMFELDVTWDD